MDTVIRLTQFSHGAGCACKLGLGDLTQVLRLLGTPSHPDLLVGLDTGDDALVWRRPDGRALVATTDFFTPIVDDPATWGRIAATNAASDVYAMGGSPIFALNIVGWPSGKLPLEVLGDVLRGANEAAAAGGWVIAGGHTIDSPEPFYGQAIVGDVQPERLLTNAGARPKQAIVMTKPIGTGIITTALKHLPESAWQPGGAIASPYAAAVASMTRRNDEAAVAAADVIASAATDVTGFGLLGHLHRLALASGVAAEVDAPRVPTFPRAWHLLDQGHVPGGTRRNVAYLRAWLRSDVDERTLTMLCDAQTSGGLLFTCYELAAEQVAARLRETGHAAAVVGRIVDGEPGTISVVGRGR